MNRTQAFLGGMCIVVLALGPGAAYGQGMPEVSAEACSDRIDNDGDGYVDCYDADCRGHAFCQQGAPPPGYAPPPPGYAPPPPGYAPPPPMYTPAPVYVPPPRPPQRGVGEVIVGFIFLPLGIILLGTSYLLWVDCAPGGCFAARASSSDYGEAWGALMMDILGVMMVVMGAIMIPSGFIKEARYNKWKQQNQPRTDLFQFKNGISLTPTLSATGTTGSLGFKLSF